MHSGTKKLRGAFLVLASGGCVAAAHAAEESVSLGGIYGYGDHTRVYGLQAAWAPKKQNELLAPHAVGLRLTAQIAHWVASADSAQYHSLTDGSVTAELRYWLTSKDSIRPFAEAGLGLHLLSHVRIAERQLGVAFGFGTQLAVGAIFGDNGRYELAAFAHHVSNGSIKQPNDGINYFGARFRMALP